MSTSMPYHRIIDITTEHVNELEEGDFGSLLVWRERTRQIVVLAPEDVPGPEAMIIAGSTTLTDIREHSIDCSDPDPDASVAVVLREMANDALADWPKVRALTPAGLDLRYEMCLRSLYLVDRPGCVNGALRDTYQSLDNRDLLVAVMTPVIPTEPPVARFLRSDGSEAMRFHLGLDGPYPYLASYLMTDAILSALRVRPSL